MKIKVLASGSKGNCTYVETKKQKILIDIGVTLSYLTRELEEISLTPNDLSAILITHSHSDHIKGLQSLVKRTNLPVYITEGMRQDLLEKIPESNIRILSSENEIEDLVVECIPTSHDVESVGYLIHEGDTSLVYITDTGYINRKYLNNLANRDIYIIESNHDEKMLMDGPYPYILKQRIISDKGHLSNTTVASYLTKLVGEKTKYIVLAHLSENNNTEDLAYQTTKNMLIEHNLDRDIFIAKPRESLETIEV